MEVEKKMNDEKIEENQEQNTEEKPEEIPAIVSLKNILEKRAQQQEEEEKRKKEEQELKGLLEQITRIIDENVIKGTSEIEMVKIELTNGLVLIRRKKSWSCKEDFTDNTEKPIKIGDLIVTSCLNEILRALREEKIAKLEIIKRTQKGIEVECRLPY